MMKPGKYGVGGMVVVAAERRLLKLGQKWPLLKHTS